VANRRADALRYRAFAIKMRQIDATGADMAVTSCANCRQTFDDGQAHYGWDRHMRSLLELVADNLGGGPQRGAPAVARGDVLGDS
jgi:Fe-S oxidoreductase